MSLLLLHVSRVSPFRDFLRQQADRLDSTWRAYGLPDPFVGCVLCEVVWTVRVAQYIMSM